MLRPYEPPSAGTASRPTWNELPPAVRAAVEQQHGPVREASSQRGGFTPGFASRLQLAGGRRVFVKAVSQHDGPIHDSYVRESHVAAALPSSVPAPRLLWAQDVSGWQVLAFEDVDARTPRRPWDLDDLTRVLDVLPDVAAALTPAPPGLTDLETTADLDATFNHWRTWSGPPSARVDLLADLEADWAALAAGDTASHFDLREDNLLLTTDGRVLLCDWNWLALTAPWTDLVSLLISAHGDGLDADALLAVHPLAQGVEPRAVDALLAMMAGYYTAMAARPDEPRSPWMRVHQAWWRDATMSWLSRRRHLAD